MNKYALIAALAAAATMTGCLDPDYVKPSDRNNKGTNVANVKTDEAKVQSEETPAAETNKEKEIAVEEAKCKCPAGAKHTTPCECGANDCKCEVVKAEPPAQAEETTVYYVQRGDYLGKISQKFNVKIDAIRRLNPQIKGDKILFGQKLLLPGKLDVGKAAEKPVVPKAEPAKKAAPAKFEGETKEYVVKSGDYLGKIAAESGVTITQLKELNGLSSNNIRVGQKLKVPAVKQEAKKSSPKKEEKKDAAVSAPANTQPAAEAAPLVAETPAQAANQTAEPVPATSAPAAQQATYIVREGEDVLELSIRWSVSPSEIRDVNNMSSDEELKPGQAIKVPAGVKL